MVCRVLLLFSSSFTSRWRRRKITQRKQKPNPKEMCSRVVNWLRVENDKLLIVIFRNSSVVGTIFLSSNRLEQEFFIHFAIESASHVESQSNATHIHSNRIHVESKRERERQNARTITRKKRLYCWVCDSCDRILSLLVFFFLSHAVVVSYCFHLCQSTESKQ